MCSLGVLILRYCPAPEKLIAVVSVPESMETSEIDEEKRELAMKYGDTIDASSELILLTF